MRSSLTAYALAVALAAVVVACERGPEPKADGKDAGEVEIAEIRPAPQFPEYDDAGWDAEPIDLSSWPGQEEQKTFELTWLGKDETVELREAPEPDAEVVATARWFDGEEVDWVETRVHVDEPQAYRMSEAVEIRATPHDVDDGELEAEEKKYALEEGDQVYVYQAAVGGGCYLGVAEEVVVGDCPDEGLPVEGYDELDAEQIRAPDSQQWWVKVRTDDGSGWFEVKEAPVEVHVREVEGYEEVRREERLGP